MYCCRARSAARLFGSCATNQRGFTLMELITVMVIVGVLAAVAVPRFFDRNTFDSRGFHDQVISTLRYAQKEAIAQRRFVCVAIAGNAVTLTYDATPPSAAHTAASCPGNPLTNPATGVAPYTVSSSVGVTVMRQLSTSTRWAGRVRAKHHGQRQCTHHRGSGDGLCPLSLHPCCSAASA